MNNKLLIILTCILVVIFSVTGYKFYQNYQKISHMKQKVAELEEEIAKAENENEQLKEDLDNLDDPEYIERIARKKLGLVKPGEVLLIPVEEKNKTGVGD